MSTTSSMILILLLPSSQKLAFSSDMASTLVDTKVDAGNYLLDGSTTPTSTEAHLLGSSVLATPVASLSTTWLKLNSTAPIQIQLDGAPVMPENEPFSGAKKLRYILENTQDLIVCPGVYDGLSARTAIELGFKSLYMVRYETTLASCYYWYHSDCFQAKFV